MDSQKAGARVLIVDDERDTRKLVRIVLEREGYVVYEAGGREDVLRVVCTPPSVDLILLDVMMPGISGLDICRELKACQATQHIPVIFLSARGQSVEVYSGLELGAAAYIVKPFSIRELMQLIRTELGRPRAECHGSLSIASSL